MCFVDFRLKKEAGPRLVQHLHTTLKVPSSKVTEIQRLLTYFFLFFHGFYSIFSELCDIRTGEIAILSFNFQARSFL